MMPSRLAPSRARCFAATALAAPVRSCPRMFDSITPTHCPFSASKRTTTKAALPATALYVLTPARPSPRSTAPMSASAPPSSGRRSRGWLTTSPAASRRNDSSMIGTASAASNSEATSCSVRYSGTAARVVSRSANEDTPVVDVGNDGNRDGVRALPGRCLQVPPSADAPDSMRGWLYTVAERRLIDELRRRRRAAEAVGALSRECENRDGDPHEALEAARLRLPRAQRRLVFMRVVEARAYSEIAGELGCNEAACKMRLSRALRRLRDDLRAES